MINNTLALIICTYNRPKAISNLLQSIAKQTMRPYEVIVVDGSTNTETSALIRDFRDVLNLNYFLVSSEHRGLTRQRNFGLNALSKSIEIVTFLDDDVILEEDYFEALLDSYRQKPEAIGVGGYITNEVTWSYKGERYLPMLKEFFFDGWVRREQARMVMRKMIGLYPDKAPGRQPGFSHGLSVGYLPPSNKLYEVDYFMGGVSSFKVSIFEKIRFSIFFEGYGLYEDFDFTIRASKMGKLYVNTSARLAHYHEPSGRPNQFHFGVMVIRNGWYVWRVGNASPKLADRIKWWMISTLLIGSRSISILKGPNRFKALTEVLGRCYGMISLIFNSPKTKVNE